MTDLTPAQKQARYAASRPKLPDPQYPTVEYRVTFRDGTERVERAIGLSQIAAYYPMAVKVELVDAEQGNFY